MKLIVEVPVTENGAKLLKALNEKIILKQIGDKLLEQLKSSPAAAFIDKSKIGCRFEP
jgi:hypothetical protein